MILPRVFEERMRELLGEEYEPFISGYDDAPRAGLRANTLKIAPQLLRDFFRGEDLQTVPWCADGYYFARDTAFRPAKHPLYHAGLYYIQEPSAMAPASVLDVSPGERVLDICAAPGGKSTQLAAKLQGKGLLVSNDISASRCRALLKNIELSGVTSAVITSESPDRLAGRLAGFFDKILVDAPCSGEGMFRRDPDAVKAWNGDSACAFAQQQRSILECASKMLAPGGMLLYSTCTFNPVENECVIAEFLDKNQSFSIVPLKHERYGIKPGRPEWGGGAAELSGCGRLWPHKLQGEGHFLALLRRNANTPDASESVLKDHDEERSMPGRGGLDLYYDFCGEYLNAVWDELLELHGDSLFSVPAGLPSLRGLRVFRSGFYLGELKNKRFEPSQALAMGLNAADAKYRIDFSSSDPMFLRYLKGESFDVKARDGWNLVCVEGFPAGWAKVRAGRMKNKYSKSWMMN